METNGQAPRGARLEPITEAAAEESPPRPLHQLSEVGFQKTVVSAGMELFHCWLAGMTTAQLLPQLPTFPAGLSCSQPRHDTSRTQMMASSLGATGHGAVVAWIHCGLVTMCDG